MTDNWKALFLVFLCFLGVFCFFVFFVCFFFLFFFLFYFFCFFVFCFLFFLEGLRVRWGGPSDLALNPPYLLFVFFCFCFVFCFGGFKGQVRWPKGPPHLALNPPYLFFFCFFLVCLCSFPFFALYYKKNLVFPLEKGIFGLFLSVSLCSSLGFFWPPPFSIFLSLSISSSSPFLLPSCLSFLLSFASLFLSLSFLFFLLHEKKQHQKDWCTKFSFINLFSFLVSCLLFSLKSLFLLLVFFADLKLCFCSTSLFLVSKKNQVEKHQFLVKRGVATKRFFFMSLCFGKCEKLSFFWGAFFGQILVGVQKTL